LEDFDRIAGILEDALNEIRSVYILGTGERLLIKILGKASIARVMSRRTQNCIAPKICRPVKTSDDACR
jgi:hypothetical protein